MISDRQLVERARAGDRSALEQLVARHLHPSFGIAYALTGSADEGDEIVQEAMLSPADPGPLEVVAPW